MEKSFRKKDSLILKAIWKSGNSLADCLSDLQITALTFDRHQAREIRMRTRISQNKLAQITSISKRSIIRYERGDSLPFTHASENYIKWLLEQGYQKYYQ